MNSGDLTVGAWIDINDDCAIYYNICGGAVELSLGEEISRYQLILSEQSLRTILDIGAAALLELRATAESPAK